jgi:hypothetical protein
VVLVVASKGHNVLCSGCVSNIQRLTLSLLMSYICGVHCKARNFNVVCIYGPTFGNAETVSFYLLHNVSTLNQCRKLSYGTVVCRHFASYQGYPNYRWGLIR